MKSEWTTPEKVRDRLRKIWDRGDVFRKNADEERCRIPLKGPSSSELARPGVFENVRSWIDSLRSAYDDLHHEIRIEWKEINHRQMGRNSLPCAVVFETSEAVAQYLRTGRMLVRYRRLESTLRARRPELVEWARSKPFELLSCGDVLDSILDVVDWRASHPSPDIYLRQLPLPAIHTKFIESHLTTIASMLELVLDQNEINWSATGRSAFADRFGFRRPPRTVRFRMLEPGVTIGGFSDLTVPVREFAELDPVGIDHVFVTENDVNGLSFPSRERAMVIFGKGYQVGSLQDVPWVGRCSIRYWGDIDTHGFAILNRLRHHLPQIQSMLMDRRTLMAHQDRWSIEPSPYTEDLPNLTAAESALYDELRNATIRPNLRLEQEFVDYRLVEETVARMK